MKRLILMGGRPWASKDGGEWFAQALFRYFPNEVKIAFCIFAQPEEQWTETETWNKQVFEKWKGAMRSIEYKTMTSETSKEVSAWADIMYIPGGDTKLLAPKLGASGLNLVTDWDWAEQECLKQRPDLPVLCIPEGDFVEFTVV